MSTPTPGVIRGETTIATNFFTSPITAERYARARPDLHPLFHEKLRNRVERVSRALDLGCGTGMSSRALTSFADTVVGLDPSLAMLSQAKPQASVIYCAGVAEAVPFRASAFDLVSVGLALHWFDRQRFLEEAFRVLVPGGWLFITNTWICGAMQGNPSFAEWWEREYLRRYPSPPRYGAPISPGEASSHGFSVEQFWEIEESVPMCPESLAEYLTTQSNVSATLERTGESIDAATAWLLKAVSPFFKGSDGLFAFGGSAWLLLRRNV